MWYRRMRSGALLILVVGALVFNSASCFPVSGDTWDHFVFAQFWPQSQCQSERNENRPLAVSVANSSCVPNGVKKWTVHGLWPTVHEEAHKPTYCNNSWHFDMAQVEDLKARLLIHWPSYLKYSSESFWKHEWEKHGTCATSLVTMDTEHKYFSIVLSLNVQYNLYGALAQGGVVPSDNAIYKVKDIEAAIANAYNAKGKVFCQNLKGGVQVLSYVETCLDKLLNPMDCYNTTALCNYNQTVKYPPIIPTSIDV